MRIGFDGKRAVSNMTGLGNYSRLVIEALASDHPEHFLYIYTPALKQNPRLNLINSLHNVEFRLPPTTGFSGSLWRSFGVTNNLRADRVDIFHGLSNELPLNIASGHVPSVVTMHDVIYRRLPYCYSAIDRRIYDFKYGRSCRNATRIIAVSECTKRDVVELYGIHPDKIDVIYQGCDDSFRTIHTPQSLAEVRTRLNLPARYILQVGTIEKRKNLELTVRALTALPHDIHLLAVGRPRKGYLEEVMRVAREAGVADRIDVRQDIKFADLPPLNAMAEAVAYPSFYEGFGIPILEALESGAPVVAATGSCLEEAGGDGAIYVAPDNPRQMGEALRAIIDRTVDTEAMKAKGKLHAARFNSSGMTEKILSTYRKAIENFSSGK